MHTRHDPRMAVNRALPARPPFTVRKLALVTGKCPASGDCIEAGDLADNTPMG